MKKGTAAATVIVAGIALACLFGAQMGTDLVTKSALSAFDFAPDDSPKGSDGIDWDYWLGVNPDIVGWITVPRTAIDGPVTQAPPDDPTYYLSHDAQRNASVAGCAYVDAACEGFDGLATVVSGHHVTDGSVLSDLARYVDPAFAQAHRTIEIQVPGGSFEAHADGAELIDGFQKAKRTTFATPEIMREWYKARVASCDVVLGEEASGNIAGALVLVTCATSDPLDDRRVIVYCSILKEGEI